MHADASLASLFREETRRVLANTPCGDLPSDAVLVLLFDTAPWWRFDDQALSWLSAVERERARRFRHAQHRSAYVLAHAMWRLALGATLGVDGADVPLTSTPAGQPQLPGTPYATSLSHSGSQVAIAMARANCVGVDIEQSPPRAALRDLSAVLCTPAEAAQLEELPHAQRESALLALWTRKEALLKAFGVGLREAPDTIAANAGPLIAPPPSAPAATACRIHPLPLAAGLVGAVAVPESVRRIVLHPLLPPTMEDDAS